MARRPFFHPSDRRLRMWLDSGESRRVAEHLETCERCAERLEQIDQVDRARTAGHGGRAQIGDALRALFSPPDDLTVRVADGVSAWRQGRGDLELFADLFTIGVDTARLITPPPTPNVPESPADDGDSDSNPPDELS